MTPRLYTADKRRKLSALCPFLPRFGFDDVASRWGAFQNTALRAPGQEAVASGSAEVVGPMESSYLNQIATFRLARSELDDHDKGGSGWELLPSAPSSPRASMSGYNSFSQHAREMLAFPGTDGKGFSQSIAPQAEPTGIHDMTMPQDMPPMVHEQAGQLEVDTALPEVQMPFTDQDDYLKMAEELGSYMTWDATVAPSWDFAWESAFE